MTNPPPGKKRKAKANSDKLNRWLSIVRKLRDNQGRSCNDWSIHYGVVPRQIKRDIKDLRDLDWPIVMDNDGRYEFAAGLSNIKYIDLLKALAPEILNLSVIEDFLEALDSSLLKELMSSFGYIRDTESDEQQPPRLMSFSSFEIFTPRQPPSLTPHMRETLGFLIEPLSQLDAAARKSLFDSISP